MALTLSNSQRPQEVLNSTRNPCLALLDPLCLFNSCFHQRKSVQSLERETLQTERCYIRILERIAIARRANIC